MTAPDVMEGRGASLSIWREAPSLNGLRTAALGAFTCDAADNGSALLRLAIARLREEGFGAVLGPMDGNTWGKHRLVTESDGRPAFLMEPANPSHHVDAFEASGLKVVSRYASATRPASPVNAAKPAPEGITLRQFDPSRPLEELSAIHSLSLEAFASNAFYAPITREQFLASYAPVLPALDPELVLIAESAAGDMKGFLFAIPNLVEGPTPRSVILKTYASRAKGVGSMLANAFHETAHRKGYAAVIHALMHDSNLSATHSSHTGGQVFRRYALWGGAI